MNEPSFVSERFKRTVVLHVIKNFMQDELIRVPLILGIHGPSGEGKTYQCEQVLRELGARMFLVSGGQLESHEAGRPAALIRATYRSAGQNIQDGHCKIAVVLINDIDTGIGNWGGTVQYTVNRQTVFGELMHLVDYPTQVEGRPTKRIPIVITGNDFSKLYEPLVRAGRMSSFEWVPLPEEKLGMVFNIYPELSKQECQTLVSAFRTQPMAFFSHLRSAVFDDEIWAAVQHRGLAEVVATIHRGGTFRLVTRLNLTTLLSTGRQLLESGSLVNHLRRQ